jgi:hypothetical protein
MPHGFKLTGVSMSMKNDPVSVKNAERLTKKSGRQTEAISFYHCLQPLAFWPSA